MLKIARCTVDWRSIRDLNSGDVIGVLSHFECDLFDLLSNAPYSNPLKFSLEKGEKSRREQQILNCRKRVNFDDDSQRNQGQLPKCRLDFESISLRLLRYVCLCSFCLVRQRKHRPDQLANISIIPRNGPFVNFFVVVLTCKAF